MVKVKICGIKNLEDAQTAIAAGADALGFVFVPKSPRYVTAEQARAIIENLPPFVQTVGLFVDEPLELVNSVADQAGLDIVQLHGDESPDFCAQVNRRVLKALRVKDRDSLVSMADYNCAAFLLDAWSRNAHGGTGLTFNWDIAAEVARESRIILAGGLSPDNIAEAVTKVKPYAVDVSSGVEVCPGKKDPRLVEAFIRLAKAA